MAFSRDSKWLAVSGDKPAAVDVFAVEVDPTPWTPPEPSAVEVDPTPWTPPEPSDDDPSHLSPRTRGIYGTAAILVLYAKFNILMKRHINDKSDRPDMLIAR
jgi:hypothetical protein